MTPSAPEGTAGSLRLEPWGNGDLPLLRQLLGDPRFLHAFPSVENLPSNAICRKLGFTLLGDVEFAYPNGSFMRCNDWRLDLAATS